METAKTGVWAGVNGGRVAWVAAAALIAAFLLAHGAVLTQGYYEPDPSGYLLTGKQLARQGTTRLDGSDLFRFHEHVWVEWKRGDVYAKYPPGYPLMIAAAWKLGGDRAAFWVSPICGALGLLACFLLLRRLVSPWLAVVGLGCLTFGHMLVYYSSYLLSHAASFAVAAWALLLLWVWWERGTVWRAALAGLAVGFAPLVRYTDALIAVPAAVVVALRVFGAPPDGGWAWRGLDGRARARWVGRALLEAAVMGGAALLCLLPLMAHHLAAFGSLFRTGYDFCGEQTAFSWSALARNVPILAHQLNDTALFLVFPLALLGLAWLWVHGRWSGLVLALWVAPPLLLYAAYYWAPPNSGFIYVRFQMSAIPGYLVAATLFLDRALAERRSRLWLPAFALLLCAGIGGGGAIRDLQGRRHATQLQSAAVLTTQLLPENAVIFAEAPFGDYLETVQDFTVYKLDVFGRRYSRRILERHGDEPLRQKERAERIAAFLGDDEQVGAKLRELAARHLEAGRCVAFAGNANTARSWQSRLGAEFQLQHLARWQSPVVWPWWSNQKPVWELYLLKKVR